jgi:acetyl-CoA carboxylase biotin carboxyl carrier protein
MATFDVDADMIRRLAGLIDETGLTEIEYDDGRRRIRVARAPAAPAVMAQPVAAAPPPAVAPVPAAAAPGEAGAAAGGVHPGAITSPMVGTAYLQPAPTSPAFVRIGDSVRKGDTLLIIEAMKVMNQIQAPRDGIVREILIANGAPVEFGQALVILD